MPSSHSIPHAYLTQFSYGQGFVCEYLMLYHSGSAQLLYTEKLCSEHADCSFILVKRMPVSLHSYKMMFSGLPF
jgi:hypothetical protein